MSGDYAAFIERKVQYGEDSGFDPVGLPDAMYDFQEYLTDWTCRKGRAEILADCGLGKSICELGWGEQVVKKTNKPVLLLTPIAVGAQMMEEAEKFGIEAKRSRDGKIDGTKCIWITNYEQLHKFNPSDFAGAIGDEASCIKNFQSARKGIVVEFMRTLRYRLLATATAAPNDYWELGTSSEALGYLGFRDMITTFFKMEQTGGQHGWGRTKYRFRGHAEKPFWQWVCSWARACRKPSDLGFDDTRFILPELREKQHVVKVDRNRAGMLFNVPARNMQEEREDRRNSIEERCGLIANMVNGHDRPAVVWCHLNDESSFLARSIPGAKEVTGSMKDEHKEETLQAFTHGDLRVLVIKPKLGAWGLNWQHCSDVYTFASHSFESHYQSIRRCWRFGQKNPVDVNIITTEAEVGVMENLKRKQVQTEQMFSNLVRLMNDGRALLNDDKFPHTEEVPSWLLATK